MTRSALQGDVAGCQYLPQYSTSPPVQKHHGSCLIAVARAVQDRLGYQKQPYTLSWTRPSSPISLMPPLSALASADPEPNNSLHDLVLAFPIGGVQVKRGRPDCRSWDENPGPRDAPAGTPPSGGAAADPLFLLFFTTPVDVLSYCRRGLLLVGRSFLGCRKPTQRGLGPHPHEAFACSVVVVSSNRVVAPASVVLGLTTARSSSGVCEPLTHPPWWCDPIPSNRG